MAKKKSRDMLLKIDDAGTIKPVAGLRARSFKINNQEIDISTSDSVFGNIARFEGDYGLQSLELSGSGLADTTDGYADLREAARLQSKPVMQVIVPGWGTFQAAAMIYNWEHSGAHSDELAF